MKDPTQYLLRLQDGTFLADEEGVTAIEYGLVAALISVFILVAIGAVGDSVVALFDLANQALPG